MLIHSNHINQQVAIGVGNMIVMKKWKRTFCSEFFKDQGKIFENFKIFEKMTAPDWLKMTQIW